MSPDTYHNTAKATYPPPNYSPKQPKICFVLSKLKDSQKRNRKNYCNFCFVCYVGCNNVGCNGVRCDGALFKLIMLVAFMVLGLAVVVIGEC